jgi:predicted enzyme related to lactoylglutathione lyase
VARLVGPDFIALQVSDLETSKRFYVDVLGLEAQQASPPSAVLFDTEPIPFAVREPLVDLEASSRLGWGVSLWMNCEDVDGLHGRIVDAGAAVTQPLSDGPFGRQFAFLDPDGYQIIAHQNS